MKASSKHTQRDTEDRYTGRLKGRERERAREGDGQTHTGTPLKHTDTDRHVDTRIHTDTQIPRHPSRNTDRPTDSKR